MYLLKFSVIVLVLVQLLTNCSSVKPNDPGGEEVSTESTVMMSSEAKAADARFNSVLEAIDKKDAEAIKAMFSERALADDPDLDASIDYLFNLFDGAVVSWERDKISYDDTSSKRGVSEMTHSWYTVYTETGSYRFLLLEYTKNTIERDMKGLYTLHAIDDADENASWGAWQRLKAPGVYMPPQE